MRKFTIKITHIMEKPTPGGFMGNTYASSTKEISSNIPSVVI